MQQCNKIFCLDSEKFSSELNIFKVTRGFCPWHFGTSPSVHMSVFVRIFWRFSLELFLRDYRREHMNHRDGEQLVHIRQFSPVKTFIIEIKNGKVKKSLNSRNLPWSFRPWVATILISFYQKCLVMCRVLFWFWEVEWAWLLCALVASKRR